MFNLFKSNKLSSVITVIDIGSSKITCLIAKINEFKPSVIFSVDNEFGGYGHPEHVFLSQLVVDLFLNDSIIADRIYQGVYTDHMEKEIIEKWLYNRMKKYNFPDTYSIAKKTYNLPGMPQPTVQINIIKQAEEKMKYLMSYHYDARKNMKKFQV